ncbi:MAG: hypothetical protein ABIP61_10695 [Burkholderiaceae bacterium]
MPAQTLSGQIREVAIEIRVDRPRDVRRVEVALTLRWIRQHKAAIHHQHRVRWQRRECLHLDQDIVVGLYQWAPILHVNLMGIEIPNSRIGAPFSFVAEAAKG